MNEYKKLGKLCNDLGSLPVGDWSPLSSNESYFIEHRGCSYSVGHLNSGICDGTSSDANLIEELNELNVKLGVSQIKSRCGVNLIIRNRKGKQRTYQESSDKCVNEFTEEELAKAPLHRLYRRIHDYHKDQIVKDSLDGGLDDFLNE